MCPLYILLNKVYVLYVTLKNIENRQYVVNMKANIGVVYIVYRIYKTFSFRPTGILVNLVVTRLY